MNNFMNPATPIASIQRMLNTLYANNPEYTRLEPDGEFGEYTLEAVMRFQRDHGLPVTGIVDEMTWDALTKSYILLIETYTPPQPVSLYSSILGWSVSPGEFSLLLFPIQAMFSALSERLGDVQSVPPSGWLNQETADNLRWMQRCGHCEECGHLNQSTWNYLRRTYETFIVRALELPASVFQ